jgi:hypothetical protein
VVVVLLVAVSEFGQAAIASRILRIALFAVNCLLHFAMFYSFLIFHALTTIAVVAAVLVIQFVVCCGHSPHFSSD